jgi:uncharacterized protein (UPF0548 family)
MKNRQTVVKRWSTALRWPTGVVLTAWRYMWRTTAVHRWELTGSREAAPAPDLHDTEGEGLQRLQDGVGPVVHRLYRVRIVGSLLTPEQLMERLADDLDQMAPSEFATFQKLDGGGPLARGDEYVVRMPGPWDGPVRVIAQTETSFRLATLEGHLEAGQIEFRARSDHRSLIFEIESWARSGDRLSDLLYSRVRFSKEVQLHMWTSVLERIVELAGGRADHGLTVLTRRTDRDTLEGAGLSRDARMARRVQRLSSLAVNFDSSRLDEHGPQDGWRRDDLIERLPHEGSGEPIEHGSWQVARRLMDSYQLASPRTVQAFYRPGTPLAGRDMLLRIRFGLLRLHVGVRVGEIYDEVREVDGRQARIFGWFYRTLEGHFEEGQMNYELWKWMDSGGVFFRLHAVSRPARSGPLVTRIGFALFGRPHQLRFYRDICRRARLLTEAQLATEATTGFDNAARA